MKALSLRNTARQGQTPRTDTQKAPGKRLRRHRPAAPPGGPEVLTRDCGKMMRRQGWTAAVWGRGECHTGPSAQQTAASTPRAAGTARLCMVAEEMEEQVASLSGQLKLP